MEEEKSYQEIRRDLVEKYKTEVVPKLAEWEKERQKYTNPFKDFKKILIKLGIFILIGYLIIPAIVIILCLYINFKMRLVLFSFEISIYIPPCLYVYAIISKILLFIIFSKKAVLNLKGQPLNLFYFFIPSFF